MAPGGKFQKPERTRSQAQKRHPAFTPIRPAESPKRAKAKTRSESRREDPFQPGAGSSHSAPGSAGPSQQRKRRQQGPIFGSFNPPSPPVTQSPANPKPNPFSMVAHESPAAEPTGDANMVDSEPEWEGIGGSRWAKEILYAPSKPTSSMSRELSQLHDPPSPPPALSPQPSPTPVPSPRPSPLFVQNHPPNPRAMSASPTSYTKTKPKPKPSPKAKAQAKEAKMKAKAKGKVKKRKHSRQNVYHIGKDDLTPSQRSLKVCSYFSETNESAHMLAAGRF